MRLIDADAVINELEEMANNEWNISVGSSKGLNDAIDVIDNAPTVEPCYQTTSCLDCKNYDKENYYCPRFCIDNELDDLLKEMKEKIK